MATLDTTNDEHAWDGPPRTEVRIKRVLAREEDARAYGQSATAVPRALRRTLQHSGDELPMSLLASQKAMLTIQRMLY